MSSERFIRSTIRERSAQKDGGQQNTTAIYRWGGMGWNYGRINTEDPIKCVSQVRRYQLESYTDTG